MNTQDGPGVSGAESAMRALLWTLGQLSLVAGLLAICVLGPTWIGRNYGHGIGLVCSMAALLVWAYLGPKPMPGFLPGLLCLWGFAMIIGGVIGQIVHLWQ